MALTETQLLRSINKKIQGAKGKIGDDSQMRRILNEGLRHLQRELDLIGLKRTGAPVLVFKDIFQYPCPSDMDYHKVVEFYDERDTRLRMEGTIPTRFRELRNPVFAGAAAFAHRTFNDPLGYRRDGMYAVESEDGDSYFLIESTLSDLTTTMLHNGDSLTENGTWSISGDGTRLRVDTQRYKEGGSSIAFDSGGVSTSITLTNSTLTAVDLSGMTNMGVGFQWIYLPGTVPTSVELRWGSDSSNYYSVTATTQQNGLPFKANQWNLISFAWPASATGTPVDSAIDYAVVIITNSVAVAQSGYRLDSIRFAKGRESTPKYYSRFAVIDAITSVRKYEFEAGSDTSVLRQDEDDLLIWQSVYIALKELRQHKDASLVLQENLLPSIEAYGLNNPSQEEPRSYTYHNA